MVQKRIHIFVTGRVQGVFFRQSTKVMAIKNNVKGWVRNLDDGRVEIIGEGEIQDIENLTQWCKTGPANSANFGYAVSWMRWLMPMLNLASK